MIRIIALQFAVAVEMLIKEKKRKKLNIIVPLAYKLFDVFIYYTLRYVGKISGVATSILLYISI